MFLLKTGKLNLKLTPRFDYIDAMTAVAESGSKQVVDTRAPDNFYGRKEEPSQCKQKIKIKNRFSPGSNRGPLAC